MIIITGAAGFIGSCLVRHLNELGHSDLVLVDNFGRADKNLNLDNKSFRVQVDRTVFIESWLAENAEDIRFVFHLGARTDTTEMDVPLFNRLNLDYSKTVWQICVKHQIPLVYASSAATYGDGALGYSDAHDLPPKLQPLNPYGHSKNDFDKWALAQSTPPPFWSGLKFFNVYGPNEYHKGRMASVIYHCYHQVKKTGEMKLFRSHKSGIQDGHQQRDFIYVKDVVKVCAFLMAQQKHSGIYNLGTGKARTFLDLASHTFLAMGLSPNISFIDTPVDIRATYQYFTEAKMGKLMGIGYDNPFSSLEDGIGEYVSQYLNDNSYF